MDRNKKKVKIEMIKDLIDREEYAKWWWKIQGYSMWPFLYLKDQVLLKIGLGDEEVKIGDIVLYENGEYFILHRVVNIQNKGNPKNFLLKGDFVLNNDGIVHTDEIIGKLTLLKKGQISVNLENPKMEKVNFILAKLSLILSLFFLSLPLHRNLILLLKYGYCFIWSLIGGTVLIYLYLYRHQGIWRKI